MEILLVVGALLMGVLLANFVNVLSARKIKKQASVKAFRIIKNAEKEAESLKKKKLLQAKKRFLEMKAQHETTIAAKERRIEDNVRKLKDKESKLNHNLSKTNKTQAKLNSQTKEYNRLNKHLIKKETELENLRINQLKQLEEISKLNIDDAKKMLVDSLRKDAQSEAMPSIQQIIEETKLTARAEAQKIILNTIQRVGVEETIENCVTTFNLDSNDLKGKIIGREGRNIRAFENATGVEVIVDDTLEGGILLSSFDSVRREIARLSLQKLIQDGRIHPARIEELVQNTSRQINEEIIQTGKKTVIELGINTLHPELIKLVGRMKYRSSYGQNLLQHSKEVAKLSSIMASELGLNPKLAKRAGLLHDIGKVPENENEKPHALLGMEWAEKYDEKMEVVNAIGAHHDEIEMTSLISPIIQVCDAISGARPGARNQGIDTYMKRLKELETLAFSFSGVKDAFAIQAGRELRVIVDSSIIDDLKLNELSYNLSNRIQSEMTYPGQVKVTVIRETRSVSIAK